MSARGKCIADEIGITYCIASTDVIAEDTGDGVQVTGATINLGSDFTYPAIAPKDFSSMAFGILGTATLTDTKSITITALVEDSANGSTWATYVTSATVVDITSAGGGTVTFAAKIGVDLSLCRQYVRLKMTPSLSGPAADPIGPPIVVADTATVFGVAVFGGSTNLPVA